MTDRPRVFTLVPSATFFFDDSDGHPEVLGTLPSIKPDLEHVRLHAFPGEAKIPREAIVRAVEWDRERVVPIMEQAIATMRSEAIGGRIGCTCSRCLAEAVFSALAGEDA